MRPRPIEFVGDCAVLVLISYKPIGVRLVVRVKGIGTLGITVEG